MNQNFMKEKPILQLVLKMSLPMAFSMLVNALYNIVDSYFVAKISDDAMTALSIIYPLQNLVLAVTCGFGIGINAVIAYFLGAKNKSAADKTATLGILLNSAHGIVLTLFCVLIAPAFLKLFTSDAEVIAYGTEYSYTVFGFALITAFELSFEKIFQAVGRMKISVISLFIGCAANIALDPIFIFTLDMGVKGAAIATVIGNALALTVYLIVFFTSDCSVKFSLKSLKATDKICLKTYVIGIPAALNMALPSLLITALNGILSKFSDNYVLILGIYYKLQTFIYLTANGIVQGIRPLVGYNYGAGENQRVRAIHKVSLIICAIIMAAGTILCLAAPAPLMGLFSKNADTISEGAIALRIISCGFIVSSVSVMTGGMFEGLGKGLPSLIISLIRYVLIIPVALLASRLLGVTGVWHAFWITEAIAAAVSTVLYFIYVPKVREA